MTPNLTGHWELVKPLSEFGFLPAPRIRIDRIQHEEPIIRILTRQKDTHGNVVVERVFTIGGDAVPIDVRGKLRTLSARWDGPDLVIETRNEVSGRDRLIEDRWSLAPDAQTLIIRRTHNNPGGPVHQKLLMRKVE